MKLSLRKSWWWLTPLACVLAVSALYLSLLHRRSKQAAIAAEIVELGGSVEVRSEAPAWLLHFASDNYRNRFVESDTISKWGPDWLRNSIVGNGIGALILAAEVADRVTLTISYPDPELEVDSETGGKRQLAYVQKGDYEETVPQAIPQVLAAVSRLATVREIEITAWEECELNFEQLPMSLQVLRIRDHFRLARAKFLPVASSRNLQTLDITGHPFGEIFDATSLEVIGNCTTLQNLSLGDSVITDRGLAELGRLSNLEYLTIDGRMLSDTGVDQFAGYSHLQGGTVEVSKVSEKKIRELQATLPVEFIRSPEGVRGGIYGGTFSVPLRKNGFECEMHAVDGSLGMF